MAHPPGDSTSPTPGFLELEKKGISVNMVFVSQGSQLLSFQTQLLIYHQCLVARDHVIYFFLLPSTPFCCVVQRPICCSIVIRFSNGEKEQTHVTGGNNGSNQETRKGFKLPGAFSKEGRHLSGMNQALVGRKQEGVLDDSPHLLGYKGPVNCRRHCHHHHCHHHHHHCHH